MVTNASIAPCGERIVDDEPDPRRRDPGRLSLWADPLHEGPVPGRLSDDELVEVRARHLAAAGDARGPRTEDVARELKEWRQTIAACECDELVLWFEHDLFDQLNLIHVLSYIDRLQIQGTKKVSLICVGSFPGHPRFKGLGELTPEELATLLDDRNQVADEQYGLAGRAWEAFRASDPRQIEELLRRGTSALPFLAPALQRHLEEFPWTTDGLSRTERRLLELVAEGPVDVMTAFGRMHDAETAFYISDKSFWFIVDALSSEARPLVVFDARPARSHLPKGTLELTPRGRDVLDGKEDQRGDRHRSLARWCASTRSRTFLALGSGRGSGRRGLDRLDLEFSSQVFGQGVRASARRC